MAQHWQENVPPDKTPRLLFEPDEWPALREKMSTPLGKPVAVALARRANNWLAVP